MRKYLIISPHLDDAVLSCGASMAHWASEGNEVVVATVFTSCGDYSDGMNALYKKRRQQDREAIAKLGCKHIHLGFIDAPFRNNNYHNFSTILFHHETVEDDFDDLKEKIEQSIKSLIDSFCPDNLLFPLGVGGHIDHNIVYWSSLQVAPLVRQLTYYEDLPYAFVPGWSLIRRAKVGISILLEEVQSFTKAASPVPLDHIALPFLQNYVVDTEDKATSNQKYEEELYYLKSIADGSLTHILTGNHLKFEEATHQEEFFSAKCEAIKAYKTEWPALFGNEENNIGTVLHPNPTLPYFERFWKIN